MKLPSSQWYGTGGHKLIVVALSDRKPESSDKEILSELISFRNEPLVYADAVS